MQPTNTSIIARLLIKIGLAKSTKQAATLVVWICIVLLGMASLTAFNMVYSALAQKPQYDPVNGYTAEQKQEIKNTVPPELVEGLFPNL